MPARFREEPLSRDEIVDVALRVVRSQGLHALTVRAMAAELDVTPNALYYHVKDKEQLLHLVADAVEARFVDLDLETDDWEDALRRHLMSHWQELARYPGVSAYLLQDPTLGMPDSAPARGIRFFEQIGFPRREARMAWAFAFNYIHGRLSVEDRLGLDLVDARGRLAGKSYVQYGVDRVIDGLRGRLLELNATASAR